MSPEALAGWVLGFLDASGEDGLTAEQVSRLRMKVAVVLTVTDNETGALKPEIRKMATFKPEETRTTKQYAKGVKAPRTKEEAKALIPKQGGAPAIPSDLPEIIEY